MSTDIHYILERQNKNGNWYTTLTEHYYFIYFRDLKMNYMDKYNDAGYQVGSRHYDLFAELSSIRGTGRNLAYENFPDDISEHTKEIINIFDEDGVHSKGHLYGNQIFDLLNDETWPTEIDYWPKAVIETVKQFYEVLPTGKFNEYYEFIYEKNPHNELDRKLRTKELLDIEKHPESWRILIYYDN